MKYIEIADTFRISEYIRKDTYTYTYPHPHAWPDPAEDVKKPVKKGSKKKQVAPPLTEALTCLPTVHGCTHTHAGVRHVHA